MVFETDDGWTVVLPRRRNNTHKPKLPKTVSPKPQQNQTHWAPTETETNPDRESRLTQKLQICIEKLENSHFFRTFLGQIHTPETLHCFRTLGRMKMVIYGIGSVEAFEPPRLQLGLAVLMKRRLDWVGDVEVFDPVISLTESNVLEGLGIRVLAVNEGGRRRVSGPVLFFMPHCEAELYENLLEANWRWDLLNRMVLLGNSFQKYEEHRAVFRNADLDGTRKHLLAVGRFTKEVEIGTLSEEYFRAFQGSSWHFFSVDPSARLELDH